MKQTLGVFLSILTIVYMGCRGERPHIKIEVKSDRPQVIPGQPIELKFRFEVDKSFDKIPYDGYVFVHFYDPLGNQAFVADHKPPQPTNTWKPGDTIEYTHLVFIPDYVYPGEYQVIAGIYDFEGVHDRVSMKGDVDGHRAYRVLKLEFLSPPPYPFVRYLDGWHEPEVNPNDPTQRWRWTKQKATAALVNPRRSARLYFEFEANTDIFKDKPQVLTLTLNNKSLDQFPLEQAMPVLKTYDLTPSDLGDADEVTLTLELDRAFVPANLNLSQDDRELGIRVYHLALQAK